MNDDKGRKRPAFEDATTLLSDRGPLRSGQKPEQSAPASTAGASSKTAQSPTASPTSTPAFQPTAQPNPPAVHVIGVPREQARAIESDLQANHPRFVAPLTGRQNARSEDEDATQLSMRAAVPLGAKEVPGLPKFYGKGPHELRGEPVATPIEDGWTTPQSGPGHQALPQSGVAHQALPQSGVAHQALPQSGVAHQALPHALLQPQSHASHQVIQQPPYSQPISQPSHQLLQQPYGAQPMPSLTQPAATHPSMFPNHPAPMIPASQQNPEHSVYASLPQVPNQFRIMPVASTKPDARLVLVHDPDGAGAQQYRLVKYKLKERNDPRVIAVTSPRAGEGATTLAANLALALAEGRRTKVALVEANFRTPSLAQAFGLDIEQGLTDDIRAHRKDPNSTWTVHELGSGFHLLPCGRLADNPAALLNSEEFSRLIQELRLYYHFVVIDTPAVLSAADINIVQDLVDGVLIATRSGVSTKESIRKSISRLAPKNLAGVVLVGTST